MLLLMAVLTSHSSAQSNPQLLFDRANEKLQAGQYQEALADYKKLVTGREVSGSLFLNMAISYVELDSLGMAKYYFLKARQFEETEERAEAGLEFVNSQFARQSAVLPKLPWEQAVNWLGEQIGSAALLGIGIFLLNAGIIGYVITWFIPYREKLIRITGLSTAILGLLIVLTSFYVHYVDQRYSRAVMVHREAAVMEKPASEGPVISRAYEGYTFTIDHKRSGNEAGWCYIRMSNGVYGWIRKDDIRIL